MTLQGLLDYYNLTIINKPEKIRNYTKLELKSVNGYKYYFSKNDLYHSYRRNNRLSKYFRGNPYTEYNVKLIRIPYTEYNNMEEFLNNCFNKD